MRFLPTVAAFCLFAAAAYAQHSTEHVLRYPSFQAGHVYRYDFAINMTAGVPGLSSQMSKAQILTELKLYVRNETDLILKFQHVDVSGSVPAVMSKTQILDVTHSSELERELKVATLIKYENGKVIGYSFPPKESLAAQKIRRSLLRSLEVYLDPKYIDGSAQEWPITYNITRKSPAGNYKSHYTVTASPYVEYPADLDIFNITRHDNFEGIPYIAYKYHHNFDKQGCPEVCKKDDNVENRFGAGCPTGQEPHHGLIKRYFVQHHNLKYTQIKNDLHLIFDHVHTKETHLADLYDQDLEVTVESALHFEWADHDKVPTDDVSGQSIKMDLDDLSEEVQEEAWEEECKYPDIKALQDEAISLLNEIADIVLADDASSDKSKEVGHKIITLQKYMQRFKSGDLRTFKEQTIKTYDELSNASEKDKIKRQLWLDILPTIGTPDSISFIVTHILEYINLKVKGISFWESKSLLEALPQNIHHPNEKTITDLMRLLDAVKKETTGYSLFYSAAYMTVARVIRKACAYPLPEQPEELRNTQSSEQKPSLMNLWGSRSPHSKRQSGSSSSDDKFEMYLQCPEEVANQFVEKVTNLLLTTKDKAKRVIYIEALALTGLPQVLPTLKKFVHGNRHDDLFSGLSHSYIDYLQTSTIFTLHSLVGRSSREVQDMLTPVFFNTTQHPKVRMAAFSVIVKSHPSLALLEEVAALSWKEPSLEVSSYVTSTFDSFGNNSLPCNQILSNRFKAVSPLLKRYDGGLFRSKNVLLNVWDDLRSYGLEKRYDFIASNESFIPSFIYSSVGHKLGNLKDFVYQFGAQVQGISSRHVYDELFRHLSWPTVGDIPTKTEDKIFDNVDIHPRDSEPWKAILYQKIFYTHSYNYLDKDDFSGKDIVNMLFEFLSPYLKKEGVGFSGHLTKLYIPSSFHTKSIFKTLPFPVHFEMKSPVLFSLKFQVAHRRLSSENAVYQFDAEPAVYHSNIYTNEILNLQDCKRVGVYYEQKTVFSHPFKSMFGVMSGDVYFQYESPKLPQVVVSHRAESGTYAGKNYLEPLPLAEDRRTIKTRPSQFKYPLSFNYEGLPSFSGEVKTENLQFGLGPIPRNWQEMALYIQRFYLNAGWRRRSVEIRRMPDTVDGRTADQLEYRVLVWREFNPVSGGEPEADWSKDLKFEDELSEKDVTRYASEGRKIYEKITKSLSHFRENFYFKINYISGNRVVKLNRLSLQYFHTLGGYLHLLHLNASNIHGKTKNEFTSDYAIGFINTPNEFKYNEKYGEQKGLAIAGISYSPSTPFLDTSAVAKAVFDYKPLAQVLPLDTQESVDVNAFEPDTHQECLKNKKRGNAHSPACIKAIREKSIYNHLRMQAVWTKETPVYLTRAAKNIELAMRHAYLSHVRVSEAPLTPGKGINSIRVEATYIDKMTDEPVVDVSVEKPGEIVNYTMISAGHIRPLSSIESACETYAHAHSNNTYPATCSLTGKYVRTYDMKSYKMPENSCTFVVSTHCTKQKKFAVLAKYDSEEAHVIEVQVHLGEDEIVLVPGSESSYTIKFNGEPYVLKNLQHAMLNKAAQISAQVIQTSDGSSYVKVDAGRAGVKVHYDGENVKVQVYSRYKGELCGLCSEYNGEVSREWRGTDRCLYKEALHFARSAIVGRCGGKKKKGREIALCENEQVTPHYAGGKSSSEEDDSEGYEPEIKRNMVTPRGSKLCFSTKPVPVCENSAQPLVTESREVDFHCLPKQDVHARKMVIESKRRILGELETKAVDYTETVEVAKMC